MLYITWKNSPNLYVNWEYGCRVFVYMKSALALYLIIKENSLSRHSIRHHWPGFDTFICNCFGPSDAVCSGNAQKPTSVIHGDIREDIHGN